MPRGPFSPARPTGVAVTVIALAAAAAGTGFAMHAWQHVAATVAGVLLLCCLAAAAASALWRLYAGPAVRGARLLAGAAGHGRPPAATLDVLAAQVRERLDHFERSHRRLQAVIRDLPHGVLVFDGDANLLEINGTGLAMLGARERDGDGDGDGPMVVAAAARAVDRYDLAALAQRAVRGEDTEVDISIPGAEPRWLRVRGRPFSGDASEHGALVVLHDVTRLHHLEQVRRDFVDNVSHELRTPFTLVSGFAETLLDGDMCPNPEARHFLEIIHKHSTRVSAIIDDLLLLAHIERAEDRSGITFEDSLLAPVISAALLSCGRTAEPRGVTLQERCEAGLTCRMNALLVEQAVTNLVDNAIKYSSRDTRVTVRGFRRGGDVVVEVIDTGIGIAGEHQQRIFERFYRVDAARSRDSGGTGLGLAIVKHIAGVHGGEVTVRSAPGGGTTFTLHLPG
ncbi:MAG: ATP-binding protein [Spirochaetaceae bacterium]|nr:ATP-binding protein [Spirochaetaceae bacterium]